MEAVPKLPMISFDLKLSPDNPPTDFGKLKQYIREFYGEDPETYSNEIRNLESLRAQAVHPVKDVTGCSVLKRYYCQLHFLQSRFPLGKEGAASIQFTWKEIYSSLVTTVTDVRREMCAILYNIGALHSQLGAADDRTTPDGLKLACSHFQCAAWAFQHLKDSYPQPSGSDLSPDLMQFMYQLCLAQAQECILEKSMTDNRKATINARVAAQIVDYYNMALNALLQGPSEEGSIMDLVSTKLYKMWKKYTRFKATYYGCIALLYQGMQAEEQQKMGERVGYYQAAIDKLSEAIKFSKGVENPEAVAENLTFTRDVVEGKRKAAKNENEFIYHEEVSDIDSLPNVKGAALVKGIPFNVNDPEISGPDIFSRLVPMKAHEASSLYSEEKAKLLRRISGMIDSKDEEVVSFMSSLQLDHIKAHLDSTVLPQDIVDRCAALSAKPEAIPNLIAAMDKLNDAYHDVDAMLKEIMQLIKTEEQSEKEYQEIMGSRPPSIVANDLTREANKYMEAHKKAAESNQTLHCAMTQHIENLRVLQQPLSELQKQLPTLASLNLSDDVTLKEVTMLVGKVDEMRRQRAMLASQLRESICSDDITTQLVTRSSENMDTIFQQEMQKHNRYVSLIEQNLAAQENILPALTDVYAKYAPTRKATAEIIRQRNTMLSALVSSYDAYEDLIAKSAKGLEFYRKLETNLNKLLQRVKGTCKVQQEERDSLLAQNGRKSTLEQTTYSTGGPKLKDYLQSKKEGYKPAAVPSSYYGSYTGQDPGGQSWLPAVRPAPVGSEGSAPVCSAANAPTAPKQPQTTHASYAVPTSTTYPAAQYPYSAQPYNYDPSSYQQPTAPYGYSQASSSTLHNLQYPAIPDYDAAGSTPYRYATPPTSSIPAQGYSSYTPVPLNGSLGQPHYPQSTPSQYSQAGQVVPGQDLPTGGSSSATTIIYSYQQPQMSQSTTSEYTYPMTYPAGYVSDYQADKTPYYSAPSSEGSVSYSGYTTQGTASDPTNTVPNSAYTYNHYYNNVYTYPANGQYQYSSSVEPYYNGTQYAAGASCMPVSGQESSNYPGYYGTPYTPYNITSSGAQPVVTTQSKGEVSTTMASPAPSSNIDLLAGLDFNISETPLQPVQSVDRQMSKASTDLASLTIVEQQSSAEKPPPSSEPQPGPKPQPVDNKLSIPTSERTSPNKTLVKDPLSDPDAVSQFVQDVEKFEKFVEGLTIKTLNGPTPLDLKWNELQDLQEKDAHKQSISVARCYPMKNRFSDILPFDSSRVELPSTKDDYINASFVKNLGHSCPSFIITQAPLPSTYADFWIMVLEKQIELVICLLADSQMSGEIYWAVSKNEDLVIGRVKVSLQSCNIRSYWVERIMSVTDGKVTRVVVHLQFTAWPQRWFPESPGPLLCLVSETLSLWSAQGRCRASVVVHCDSGAGRSGCFVVAAAFVAELQSSNASARLPDPVVVTAAVARQRKNPLRDRDHLKFVYQCLLYYAQDMLMKRGILASKSTFDEKRTKQKSHTRHPSEDFLLNSLKEPSQFNMEERRASDASSTGSLKPNDSDPLSQIDPLWPIKRYS